MESEILLRIAASFKLVNSVRKTLMVLSRIERKSGPYSERFSCNEGTISMENHYVLESEYEIRIRECIHGSWSEAFLVN